jgi:non-ribosomal peptide synthetase component E (peptide arylation enzyme)
MKSAHFQAMGIHSRCQTMFSMHYSGPRSIHAVTDLNAHTTYHTIANFSCHLSELPLIRLLQGMQKKACSIQHQGLHPRVHGSNISRFCHFLVLVIAILRLDCRPVLSKVVATLLRMSAIQAPLTAQCGLSQVASLPEQICLLQHLPPSLW